jgi:hypothetical protein
MKAWKKGLAAIFMAAALAGCDVPPNQPGQNAAPQSATQTAPVKKGAGSYYVNVDLRESHSILFSDPSEHVRDAMNATQFALPTAKARYAQLHRGDNLVDKFRAASFWVGGSLGSTKMSVDEVPAVRDDADASACRVQFELSQSHFTLSLGQHLKDAGNKIKFDWDVPGDAYKNMNVGDDLIEHGFNTGSLIIRGRVGNWHLKVLEKKGPCTP